MNGGLNKNNKSLTEQPVDYSEVAGFFNLLLKIDRRQNPAGVSKTKTL